MPVAPLSTESSYLGAGLPESRLVNMYLQPTPDGPTRFAFKQRPGLKVHLTLGSGPIRGIFRKSGVFGGDLFSVSGTGVYRGSTSVGTVANGVRARLAASDTTLGIVSGSYAYLYNGSALNQVTDPDLPSVSDIANLAGRFVYVAQESDRFLWSTIGDGSEINGVDFATAESSPDWTRTVLTTGDDLIFLGGDTVEFWNPASSGDSPYQRSSGRRYEKGAAGQTAVGLDNTFIWLGSDLIVYRGGGVPLRISTYGIESRIKAMATPDAAYAYDVVIGGHTYYVLTCPGVGTFAYDLGNQQWAEWTSYGLTSFRPSCSVTYEGVTYLGDSESGNIYTLDETLLTDNGEPLIREVSSFVPLTGGVVRCNNMTLLCAKGVGLSDGENPQVEMRYTDHVEADWSDWLVEYLGVQGDRGNKTTWWGLGLMVSPGRAFQFRCTDPVDFTPYGLTINESRP